MDNFNATASFVASLRGPYRKRYRTDNFVIAGTKWKSDKATNYNLKLNTYACLGTPPINCFE